VKIGEDRGQGRSGTGKIGDREDRGLTTFTLFLGSTLSRIKNNLRRSAVVCMPGVDGMVLAAANTGI
jgi:hypothetical protein